MHGSEPWLRELDQLAVLCPGVTPGLPSRARQVLTALAERRPPFADLAGADPLGNHFEAEVTQEGRASKPRAARVAEERRSCFLRLVLVCALRPLGELPAAALFGTVIERACAVEPVLQPARRYAGSRRALDFFNGYLKDSLRVLEQRTATRLLSLTEHRPYDGSPESVTRWGRAWSAAVAVEHLDWLRHVVLAAGTARDLALAVWEGPDRTQHPGNAPALLPSSHRRHPGLAIALHLRPVLAQVLHYGHRDWAGARVLREIRIKVYDREDRSLSRPGDAPRPRGKSPKTACYRGLKMQHLRCAVLAELLLPGSPRLPARWLMDRAPVNARSRARVAVLRPSSCGGTSG